jgi:hypothetical protein
MDNEIETTFWNKKSDDVTLGDSVKLVGIVSAVSIAVPLAVVGVVAGVAKIGQKIRERYAQPTLTLVESTDSEG